MALYLLLPVIAAVVFLSVRIKRPEPGSRLAPVTGSVSDAMIAVGEKLCRAGHSVRWAAPESPDTLPGAVAGTCRRCGGMLLIADGHGEVNVSAAPILATDRGPQRCRGDKNAA